MNIAIVGLGYVGLPLSLQFAKNNVKVIGIDLDIDKVQSINSGRSYINHINNNSVIELVNKGLFSATHNYDVIKDVDAVIICVPTPLSKNQEPDLSYVLNTGRSISKYLRTGVLVSLESSTYPGTTEIDLRLVLEEGSGLKAGKDFHLCFSPERENPGSENSSVALIPKLVGGYTKSCELRAIEIYSRAIQTLIPVSSCRTAEATKLLENIFRGVNIALVNELKVVYSAMGIDIWEVIEAAKTKPFGYMAFYPGPGLGGHCIPIDPFYLTWKAREYGLQTKFIELAGEINTSMPDYVIKRSFEALNSVGKSFKNASILVIGLAYKPNVDDFRESPTFVIMDKLNNYSANVDYYDSFIPVIPNTCEYSKWSGKKCIDWNKENIVKYDLVIVTTNHSNVNYAELSNWAVLIVDTRNAVKYDCSNKNKIWRA